MIEGISELREAYRDEQVVSRYIDQRFTQPLGALLHDRQARALRRLIERHAPDRVLEIAPGPARLTTEVAHVLGKPGTAIDASLQMLGTARRRVAALGRSWRWINGDAFELPFGAEFDLVYTFRLIRHFERAERLLLYRQVARVLRPGGFLVFDAVNEVVSAPRRARAQAGEFEHYDALLRPESLGEELAEAGFDVESLEGVQHHHGALEQLQVLVAPRSRRIARAAMEIVDRLGGQPLEWIVTCRRR